MKANVDTMKEQKTSFSYEVVRSNRKTMAIEIKQDGTIVVRVPKLMDRKSVERFVSEHYNWIEKHYEAVSEKLEKKQAFRWEDGAELLLSGDLIKLRVAVKPGSNRMSAFLKDGELMVVVPRMDEQAIEAVVKAWYKDVAKRVISQRVEAYAGLMGVDYNRICVRAQKTRWGSCSGKGNLNFNWKLLLMPPKVLDYVVVHELSHRREMNHSERFWSIVGQVMPDYQEQRRRLREYENKIASQY